MTKTLTRPTSSRRRMHRCLTDVVMSSNPDEESRWSKRTGRQADIGQVDFYEDGSWSIACNRDRIGPGTVGWIARQGRGGNPPLGGFIVCVDVPHFDRADNEWYVEGRLHGGLDVPGACIAAAGWPKRRAPWGSVACRQFQNGEKVGPDELNALLGAVPDSILRTVMLEHLDVVGSLPSWA